MGDSVGIEKVISDWMSRLRADVADAVAVILKGSAARGELQRHSDIDFDVLVDRDDDAEYRSFLEEHDGRLLHVSVATHGLRGWLADEGEPAAWAYGLPVRETTRLLWAATVDLTARLDRPWQTHPAAQPEMEDTIDALAKAHNAALRGDEIGMRQAASLIGGWIPAFLVPVNQFEPPSHQRQALDVALGFAVAPTGWAEDLGVCLGVAPATAHHVVAAADRIVMGTIELIAAHLDAYAHVLTPDDFSQIRDGPAMRWISQVVAG